VRRARYCDLCGATYTQGCDERGAIPTAPGRIPQWGVPFSFPSYSTCSRQHVRYLLERRQGPCEIHSSTPSAVGRSLHWANLAPFALSQGLSEQDSNRRQRYCGRQKHHGRSATVKCPAGMRAPPSGTTPRRLRRRWARSSSAMRAGNSSIQEVLIFTFIGLTCVLICVYYTNSRTQGVRHERPAA
jgi:hypothetical protein